VSASQTPATELSSVLARVREHNDFNLLLDVVPYARFLGLRALSVGEQVRVHLPFRPGLVGNPMLPALHGGVVGACLEMAALLQVLPLGDGWRTAAGVGIVVGTAVAAAVAKFEPAVEMTHDKQGRSSKVVRMTEEVQRPEVLVG